MEEKYFMRCPCDGRTFTSDEWSEWVRTHPSSEVVHQHGEFGFNIHGVCMTPRVCVDWKNSVCQIKITTAKSDNGRWNFGVSTCFWDRYSSSPTRFVEDADKGFDNEKKAIVAGLDMAKKCCQQVLDDIAFRGGIPDDDEEEDKSRARGVSVLPKLNEAMVRINQFKSLYNPQQLELFA
ncbi:hypothetical protein [Hoylesella loescheii]|uniref:Uncharacterized protein n=1 Tax=Hoylesella loescheii DSM 19665 = JCM 12249 = ATCC 15930 TaxID=1122985 RepID=A0A069QI86_HOYLO|nr:hypothetical protein [Hoylesella loescheii]KDR51734.1 hypothetical protein HMPREF1991_02247 [Hoylesella loescheii DSM 19665 = JCM 12249 = ATCC 15930]